MDALDIREKLVRSHHQHEFEKEGNLVDVRIVATVVVQEDLQQCGHDVALRGVQQSLQIHGVGHQKRLHDTSHRNNYHDLLAPKISEPRAVLCGAV